MKCFNEISLPTYEIRFIYLEKKQSLHSLIYFILCWRVNDRYILILTRDDFCKHIIKSTQLKHFSDFLIIFVYNYVFTCIEA